MFDKPKKKRKNDERRNHTIVILIVVIALLMIGMLAFWGLGIVTNEFRFDYTVEYHGDEAKSAFEDHLETSLLTSASNVHFLS